MAAERTDEAKRVEKREADRKKAGEENHESTPAGEPWVPKDRKLDKLAGQ